MHFSSCLLHMGVPRQSRETRIVHGVAHRDNKTRKGHISRKLFFRNGGISGRAGPCCGTRPRVRRSDRPWEPFTTMSMRD